MKNCILDIKKWVKSDIFTVFLRNPSQEKYLYYIFRLSFVENLM